MTDDRQTDRTAALTVLRETLSGVGVKPADRVRAAQLLLEHDAPNASQADALQLSDDELLRIAQGGTPPAMGPTGTRVGSVPSDAPTGHPESLDAESGGPKEDPRSATHPPGLVLPKGPKEDPRNGIPPGGSIWGPKPSALKMTPPAPKNDAPIASQIKVEDTPTPEPWE